MYCITHFSVNITTKICEIGDIVYAGKWYNNKSSLNIFTLLIIENTQRPRYLTGFGMISANNETFAKVWMSSIINGKMVIN